jgi:serine phosphatase RsbU (regulator of sigma subunit)
VHRQRLLPGSVTVLYSDGVVEATDGMQQRYSVPRLEQIAVDRIDRERRLPLVVRGILDDVLAYTGGTLRDDATLFGVRWAPT